MVVQVGGGLREYDVAGFPVLDGYAEEEMASHGRGQVLVPWPNRLADGRYDFGGETLQLPLGEPARRNAIHGLVRWSEWRLLEHAGSRVRMGHVLWPLTGYPFTLALELEYDLSDAGLRVTMRAENVGRRPAPYGAGMHPYVRAELGPIDGTTLRPDAPQGPGPDRAGAGRARLGELGYLRLLTRSDGQVSVDRAHPLGQFGQLDHPDARRAQLLGAPAVHEHGRLAQCEHHPADARLGDQRRARARPGATAAARLQRAVDRRLPQPRVTLRLGQRGLLRVHNRVALARPALGDHLAVRRDDDRADGERRGRGRAAAGQVD